MASSMPHGMATGMPPGMSPPMPRMPGMLPVPSKAGMPGMAGAPLDSEAIAQMRFQQAAAEYDQTKTAGIAPEIAELSEYHGLDERATRALDEEMKKRRDSFDA